MTGKPSESAPEPGTPGSEPSRPRHLVRQPSRRPALPAALRNIVRRGSEGSGSREGRDAAGTGGPRPGGLRRVLLAVLAGGTLVAGTTAAFLDDPPRAGALGTGTAETPVLSARRVPELLTGPVAERRLAASLDNWMGQSPPNSCLVVESSGRRIYAHNPDASLPGASTQKIVTATAALLAAGPDARFETVAAAAARPSDGVIAGDLYIVGGGDPLLGTRPYGDHLRRGGDDLVDPAALADEIVAAGVTHIRGRVLGDDSRYDAERFHDAWPDRFRSQNPAGPISALNINDGFTDFPGSSGAARDRAGDPATSAAGVMTALLRDRGVTIDGEPGSGHAPEGATTVASLSSKPLSEIVAQMLTNSDNETAEMLLKELGVRQSGAGTWDAGAAAAAGLLQEAGVTTEGVEIVDGSGLSDSDRLTCGMVVDLLTRPGTGPVVVEGLAVAGRTGTLDDDFGGTPVAGRLRGKTGTLRNVNALSGRVRPDGGGPLSFSYIATVPDPGSLTTSQIDLSGSLGEILVERPPGVEVDRLLPAGYPTGTPDGQQVG